MASSSTFRIGTAAGFPADRLANPAKPHAGFTPLLAARLHAVLPPCASSGTRIITNMGVANPAGAASRAAEVARQLGFRGLTIAFLEGDDVTRLIGPETPLAGGLTVAGVGRWLIGANADLGADTLLEGGVNPSLNLDSHGKSWSYLVLALEVDLALDA